MFLKSMERRAVSLQRRLSFVHTVRMETGLTCIRKASPNAVDNAKTCSRSVYSGNGCATLPDTTTHNQYESKQASLFATQC